MKTFAKSIKTIQDRHLNRIKIDKNTVVSLVIGLSDATYPLLQSHLLHLRKLNGVHNKTDEKNESAQILKEHNYVCEHDLLYFLTVTQQFNLIRELFQENEKLARMLVVIDEIERERKKDQSQNYLLTVEANKRAIEREKVSPSQTVIVPLMQDIRGLNGLLLYQYYDDLLKDTTFHHHLEQSAIYEQAHAERMARMDDLSQDVLNHPLLTAAGQVLLNMCQEYRNERSMILSIPTMNLDGFFDFEAAENRHRDLQELDEHQHELFVNYMEDLCRQSVINAIFKEKLRVKLHEEREAARFYQEKLHRNEELYQRKVQEILAHRQRAQNEANLFIGQVISDIGKVPLKDIPVSQRGQFTASFALLMDLKEQLKEVDGIECQRALLAQCAQELDMIGTIATSAMTHYLKQQFEERLDVIHQAIGNHHRLTPNYAAHNFDMNPGFDKPDVLLAHESTHAQQYVAVNLSTSPTFFSTNSREEPPKEKNDPGKQSAPSNSKI